MLATLEREETDEGLTAARRGVERTCIASRRVLPVAHMIRFVAGPDGQVVPDIERKLPGRGAWVEATREALDRALREKSFARAFRGKAAAPPDLPELTERLLEKSALDGLSLANKAGLIVTGAVKVAEAISDGKAALLLHASDAQPDGVRKLNAAVRAAEAAGHAGPGTCSLFRGEQLDLALGRTNVVHAALLVHPAGAGFLGRCLRLERWHKAGTAGSAPLEDQE